MRKQLKSKKVRLGISVGDINGIGLEVIMKAFYILCFKTNNHMKRGQGILQFPVKSLYRIKKQVIDLVDFVNNMFKNRIQNEKRI